MFSMEVPTQEKEAPICSPLLQPDHASTESFGSLLFEFLFFVSATIWAVIVLAFLIFGPPSVPLPPNPGSFSVTQLNIWKTDFSAVWELELAFSGQVGGIGGVFFESLEGVIFYWGDIPLALTCVGPFALGSKEQGKVRTKVENPGSESIQLVVESGVSKEIQRDQQMGMVNFSLRINRDVQEWELLWAVSHGMLSNCWDLAMSFEPNSGIGRLIDASIKQCK